MDSLAKAVNGNGKVGRPLRLFWAAGVSYLDIFRGIRRLRIRPKTIFSLLELLLAVSAIAHDTKCLSMSSGIWTRSVVGLAKLN